VPRDSRVVTLIRAVYKDFPDPVEKPTREPVNLVREASLREEMTGFHYFMREFIYIWVFGEDTSIMELNVVPQIDSVLH
jgi:hypothetical protein